MVKNGMKLIIIHVIQNLKNMKKIFLFVLLCLSNMSIFSQEKLDTFFIFTFERIDVKKHVENYYWIAPLDSVVNIVKDSKVYPLFLIDNTTDNVEPALSSDTIISAKFYYSKGHIADRICSINKQYRKKLQKIKLHFYDLNKPISNTDRQGDEVINVYCMICKGTFNRKVCIGNDFDAVCFIPTTVCIEAIPWDSWKISDRASLVRYWIKSIDYSTFDFGMATDTRYQIGRGSHLYNANVSKNRYVEGKIIEGRVRTWWH